MLDSRIGEIRDINLIRERRGTPFDPRQPLKQLAQPSLRGASAAVREFDHVDQLHACIVTPPARSYLNYYWLLALTLRMSRACE